MCLGARGGGRGCCTPYTVQSRGVSGGGIQYQPGIRWQQTLKQRQNIRLLQLRAVKLLQQLRASLPGFCCGKTGLSPPAAPVAGLEMSQNSFPELNKLGRGQNKCNVKSNASFLTLTSRTRAEQRSGKTSYILTSASGRGCKTPATGAARPASQSISTASPASCPTLRCSS